MLLAWFSASRKFGQFTHTKFEDEDGEKSAADRDEHNEYTLPELNHEIAWRRGHSVSI